MADAQVKRAINNILKMTVEQSSRDFRQPMKVLLNKWGGVGSIKSEDGWPLYCQGLAIV